MHLMSIDEVQRACVDIGAFVWGPDQEEAEIVAVLHWMAILFR
jgi:hypothetical protein